MVVVHVKNRRTSNGSMAIPYHCESFKVTIMIMSTSFICLITKHILHSTNMFETLKSWKQEKVLKLGKLLTGMT